MPTYDYFCTRCNQKLEVSQKISDAPLTFCDQCQQETLVRKPSGGIGLAFSGDGFYSTMYGNKPSENSGCCPCGKNKKTNGCGNS